METWSSVAYWTPGATILTTVLFILVVRILIANLFNKYIFNNIFIIGDWNAKAGSQETLGVTGKFGLGVQNEAGQRLTEFCQRECTGHSKHSLPTTQEKTLHMDITRWSTPKSDWLYSLQPKMEKLYTVSKNKTGSWLWLRPWTPCYHIQT